MPGGKPDLERRLTKHKTGKSERMRKSTQRRHKRPRSIRRQPRWYIETSVRSHNRSNAARGPGGTIQTRIKNTRRVIGRPVKKKIPQDEGRRRKGMNPRNKNGENLNTLATGPKEQ
jgi:hypothetical protein